MGEQLVFRVTPPAVEALEDGKRAVEASPAKTGAGFNRGGSCQTYSTPKIFIDAVKKKFSIREFAYDLAASTENTKAKHFFCEEEDSLAQDWTKLRGDLWLNPPYSLIAPWAQKCAMSAPYPPQVLKTLSPKPPRRIFFLVPAAVGANWWRDFVHEKAAIKFLNGRISFDGKNGYPRDCALCVYGEKADYECWHWMPAKGK